QGYARTLDKLIPHGWLVLASAAILVSASVWVATRLPSQFFPPIDESMERVYVRLPPGTSLADSAKQIDEMADTLAKELPPGLVTLRLTNVGSPMSARAAMNSPNWGPHMGFIRLALTYPEKRGLSQDEIAVRIRHILDEKYPGVEF